MTLHTDPWRIGVSALLVVAQGCALAATGADMPAIAPAAEPASAAAAVPMQTTTITTTTVTTVAVVPQAAVLPRPWTLALLPDDPVPFHGLPPDVAGLGSSSMLYPGGLGALGLIGLVVGVATHAAIVGGVRSSHETKAQEAADKVLDPYRDALAAFRLRDLEQRALSLTPQGSVATLRGTDEVPAGDVIVMAAPAFSMTADGTALVMDEIVIVHEQGAADPGLTQTLRIVSAPRVDEDLHAAWSADNGAALKSTASAMMAESLDIALAQSRHPADDKAAFRTLRYSLGTSEKMERAQLVDETCGHLLMRTLRGGLLVVPHRPAAALPAGCPTPPPMPVRAVAPAMPASGAASAATLGAAPAASAVAG